MSVEEIVLEARAAAQDAGLVLVDDEGLVIENAGLTEWPVPLLGRFDEAFLDSDLGETKMDTNSPRLTCSHAEVRDVPRDCLVTVTTKAGPRDFIVLQVQPDGTGFALVTLTHDE